ncbi:hypothetical protein MFM001_26910 [Mycobacterium sp. MFM001]|uniref:hypothetical protein n=1 Tax=Mycobacterium sp. MFM001 TaxID=2049453 RepID=UPI000DA5C922|nr:hypothetical protein [Mycobacterium sp. MFM001]GBE66229.1 hypothetical protein MFM001_26910 [Mycobacterium sp. MFM001]
MEAKAADVEAKVAAVLAEGETVDAELAKAMGTAASVGDPGAQLVKDWKQGGDGKDGPSIDGKARVNGPAEQTHDDLGATIPGTGIRLGGDGVSEPGKPGSNYPRIHVPAHDGIPEFDGPNPLPVRRDANGNPLERPLPTGTAVGPDGKRYGFYSIVPYNNPDGTPNGSYSTNDTVVVDLDHPNQVLYTLHGVSQASGVFDPNSGRMVIVGNQGVGGPRTMWESAPVNQNSAWGNTLQQQGTFSGAMNGNRESQIVALPNNGGYMLVGAADGRPIEGAVASTPEGLLTAVPKELLGPIPDSSGKIGVPYGPTITGFSTDSHGHVVVDMRVSTFTNPKPLPYNPETYDTTFTVTP